MIQVLLVLFVGLSVNFAWAQGLTLNDYKNQVMQNDPETKAVLAQKKGSELSQDSAELMTSVSLFANTTYLDDQRPTLNPSFQGLSTKVNNSSVGIQQQTRLGLKWALSQNISKTEIIGANPAFLPLTEYYDVFPKLELSLPLWRNWLGRETTGEVDQLLYQAKALAKQSDVAWIQRQNQIEETFYRLLSQQESFQIQKDSLERAEKILEWTQGRVRRNLVDASELYQAQAAVASRRIDLVNAEANLKQIARTFNALRGAPGEEVPEKLVPPDLNLKTLNLDKKAAKVRKDTLAQKDLNASSEARYRSQKEKNKPSLDLTVQAFTQGRDRQFTGAEERTFREQDYLYVGLNFVMPLDQGKAGDARAGFANLESAQKYLEQARVRDEKLTWEQTVDQAEALVKQVALLRELETFQKKKADAERDRLSRGRSTTFQVLSFEQDYNTIRSQRILIELQARQFVNSLALYESH